MHIKKLNCAVVGLGIGEQHASAILNSASSNLAAICELDQEKINYFLHKYKLDFSIVKSFTEILLDDQITLVSIASFDDAHFDQVMACLHHGKCIFVEKPLCQTKEQLKEIYNRWKKNRLALASNLVLRKAPLYGWLKKIISSGQMGEIYAMDMDYLYGRIHKITEGWRKDVKNYSVMAGGGIHLIDLMMQLINQTPTKVQSSVNKIATTGTNFRYPDFHAATFYFANGIVGRVTANFGCMHKHQHVIRIFGTKATFVYDDMGARIHWNRDESSRPELIDLSPRPMHKGDVLMDFIESTTVNNKYNTAYEFDLMSTVIAADESILHQKTIDIRYMN